MKTVASLQPSGSNARLAATARLQIQERSRDRWLRRCCLRSENRIQARSPSVRDLEATSILQPLPNRVDTHWHASGNPQDDRGHERTFLHKPEASAPPGQAQPAACACTQALRLARPVPRDLRMLKLISQVLR